MRRFGEQILGIAKDSKPEIGSWASNKLAVQSSRCNSILLNLLRLSIKYFEGEYNRFMQTGALTLAAMKCMLQVSCQCCSFR